MFYSATDTLHKPRVESYKMRITQEQKYQRRWWTLGILALSLVIIGLDNTILNVAIPTLQNDLSATASELQWMVDSYVLVFAGLLLTMGALGDRFGRAGALATGLAIFGVASLVASQTTTATQLISARAVMGIGGALIMPATLSIITDVFPREERGRAIGIWAGVAGAGIGLGPIVGGVLLESFAWGSVFLVNVPIVLIALVGGYFLVPSSRDPEATPLDLKGAALSMVAISALVYSIIEGPAVGWTSGLVLTGFVAAIAFGAAFVLTELRTEHPMLNLSFFANRRFSGGATAISIAFFSLFGVIFLLTQYLQFVQGYTALEAGLRTAPIAIGMIIGSATSPRLAERFGTTRVVAGGLLLLAALLTTFTFLTPTTPYWALGLGLVVMSTGLGTIMAPSTDAVMGAVPLAKAGVASATNDVARQVSGAVGVAVIGSAFNSAYSSNVAGSLTQLPAEAAAAAGNSIGAAMKISSQLPEQAGAALATAARQGFTDAMGVAVVIAVAAALVGAFLVYRFMPADHLPSEETAPRLTRLEPAIDNA
jgi:EmrB/QacA subfamily drug resistance transporter